MDITDSLAPRSDQLNADDLIAEPRTVTITDVRKGTAEQPVEIVTAEYGTGRPYKPGKSMRRVLAAVWGTEAAAWVGKRLTLYCDPDITFGRDKVGGIRVSHMSSLDQAKTLPLTVTRGKRKPYTVQPLPDAPPIPTDDVQARIDKAIEAFAGIRVNTLELEQQVGEPRDQWDNDTLTRLGELFKELSP